MEEHNYRLCALADVPGNGGLRVVLATGTPVAVFKAGSDVYVVDDLCTHNGASLSKYGEVEGHVLECTWHSAKFDL